MVDQESTTPVLFPPEDEFTIERIFPIRSLLPEQGPRSIPIEETQIEGGDAGAGEGEGGDGGEAGGGKLTLLSKEVKELVIGSPEPAQQEDKFQTPPYIEVPPKEDIRRLSEAETKYLPITDDGDGGRIITNRFSLAPVGPTQSGPPGVLSSVWARANTGKKFYRCEDEPIHIPGAIQNHGVLLALRFNESQDLEVRIASENAQPLLVYGLEELFSLPSFLDILDPASREDMVPRIKYALRQANMAKTGDTHLDVFVVSIILPSQARKPLWCALHVSNGTKDLIVCEFEQYSEVFRPEDQFAKALPSSPSHMIHMDVGPEELLKSTSRASLPLRVLDISRRKKKSGVPSMDVLNVMTEVQEQLANAANMQEVLDLVVGIISELTGMHRVMFYRFDTAKNGSVDAELVNTKASKDLFRGLHFPASDIPPQARALYKINRIRVLYDRDAETARLVCREKSDFEVPLDLTHAYLRAMSPVHLKYLANMDVRSSMSISIVINSDLWGLVACHTFGDVGISVTPQIRELCRNIGDCAALRIERLLLLQRLQARKPPISHANTSNPSPASFIAASSADLLREVGADFGLLSIEDEARPIGRLNPYRESLIILAYLQRRRFRAIYFSQNINQDFPDIKYKPGIHSISGLLLIPLSMGGRDFLVFFRKGQLREISWAGNPYEKMKTSGSDYLEPRTSFKRWSETVVGMSKEWSEHQLETASTLSLLYGRFIETWRQKEASGNRNPLNRMLLRNSAHEVRTPLNAIVNYLEMALENKLEESTREILFKAHKASRSLVYVIDDLLNLTKAEERPLVGIQENFDLMALVSDVISAFRKEAERKSLGLTVSIHQGIPEMVRGDPNRLRQVLSNLISNAFQHSVEGGVKVSIRLLGKKENHPIIGITVQDLGAGMSEKQLDDLFQSFEEVLDDDSRASPGVPTQPSGSQSGEAGNILGIGLAVVARYIRNIKGQIRVKSDPQKGTIFGIELPFQNAQSKSDAMLPLPSYSIPNPQSKLQSESQASMRESDLGGIVGQENELGYQVIPDSPATDSQPPSVTTSTPGITPGITPSDYSGSSLLEGFPFPRVSSSTQRVVPREALSVLIAEDNPVNAKILIRRLSRLGHKVEHVQDGQECHDLFVSKPTEIHVILMDLQMPLVDGIVSTRMIRAFENEVDGALNSTRHHVPIIAVSASLVEEERFKYVQHGFDAWILKPINFARLDLVLKGIHNPEVKKETLYTPGNWEKGGWFLL